MRESDVGGSIYREILMSFGEIYSKKTTKGVHFASTQKCLYKCESHRGEKQFNQINQEKCKTHTHQKCHISTMLEEAQKLHWQWNVEMLDLVSVYIIHEFISQPAKVFSLWQYNFKCKKYIFTLRHAETISLSTAPDLNTHPYRVHHPRGQLGLATENSIEDFGLFTWRTQYMCLMTPTKFTSSLSH